MIELIANGLDKYVFVDVREIEEIKNNPIHDFPALRHPTKTFFDSPFNFDNSKKYILFCGKGSRSLKLTERLRSEGKTNVFSLKGGVVSLKNSLKNYQPIS